jgi:KUP system potassium uptake protein
LVVLATIATIIANQSIITGAFSITRQAIQLGWLPRLHITQTSAAGYGQIYVGSVNWLLMLVTLGLTVWFGKSDNLASAYGIAVSATMLMTSALLFIAMDATRAARADQRPGNPVAFGNRPQCCEGCRRA